MLRYGIFSLLIILILTIALSYYYNMEAFANLTAPVANPAAIPAVPLAGKPEKVKVTTPKIAEINTKAIDVPEPNEIPVIQPDLSTIDTTVPSKSIKDTNTDSAINKKDTVNIRTEPRGKYLRVFASMPTLPDGQSLKFWLIANDPMQADGNLTKTIWRNVFVTNNSKFESAAIPEEEYLPYVGQTAYLVPRGLNNPDDSYGTFIIPSPSKPNVINPQVSLSDTGYAAMKLNKHSNLLNDVQKIIHNEMLANRSLDVIVKNANGRGVTGASVPAPSAGTSVKAAARRAETLGATPDVAKAIAKLPPKIQAKALSEIKNENSCNSCNSCNGSERSENDPDMSKYIRKDQIPCWGCSLDY